MPEDPEDPGAGPHEVISMPSMAGARERLSQAQATLDEKPRPDLTDGQWAALFNLAFKQSGGDAPWINIADARTLTDQGLAHRTGEGWNITPSGLAAITAEKRRLSLEG